MKPLYPIISLLLLLCISSCEKAVTEPKETEDDIDFGNLLYTSDKSSSFETWKLSGKEHTQITDDSDTENWWPRLSPDQSQMLFYKSPKGSDILGFAETTLWLHDMERQTEELIFDSKSNGWAGQGMANWSPDGSQLVFSVWVDSTSKWQIFICKSDGSRLRKISTRSGYDYFDPIFHTDGQSIICCVVPEDEFSDSENYELFEIDTETSEETRLTFNEVSDHHPHISPDGNTVAFESLVDPNYLSLGKWALKELDLSSLKETEIVSNDNLSFYPRFDPTGAFIFYVSLDVLQLKTSIQRYDRAKRSSQEVIDEDANFVNVEPY